MNHTIIIAEAGVNHNGSIELAKLLIDEAVESGVDYIKFQTFKSENLVTRTAKQADYQKKNIGDSDNSQYNMLKELELSEEQHFELIEYCNKKGIKFFSTAFDMDSIDFLTSLNLGLWKIPSGELTSYPYVKKIASFGEPVILSTGMSSTEEISDTVNLLVSCGLPKEKITILHCNTEYPTPMCDVNLLAMNSIKKRFQTEIGYSDHTVGIEVPIAAVALGAKVIEKHFTLDRNLPGPDHKASLEPSELKAMVSAIRNIEQALGSEEKKVSSSEMKNKAVARKSIVAAKAIKAGEMFSEENLTVKRPGIGISPMKWESVIGQVAIRDFEQDELIEL
ncbi:sialic acid synthase [Bacteroides uniformis]|jgi:N,N'-diacetyllegionaminate synthase|uniref:Sialic acid synthase n=1 Tax=Bacteroides uniformis TaxID=820 RepID=A0A174R1S4_BACUN|nr:MULTISPECIES: N-acetylneuraminate synthase [Bacteroides]MDC1838185.1 N-acetylneuraminate synthase [Bacteroides uniformis]RJV20918.1 N-acetylneuraminate synthase [Bacteroides sp. AF27-10BH]CUP77118.1 sialic acid synthase [Bacteroides uniformis]